MGKRIETRGIKEAEAERRILRVKYISGGNHMNTILDIRNVSKRYGNEGNAVSALKNVSFTIEQGEFTGIMGSSGCGKSTLLNMIATILMVTHDAFSACYCH